MNPVSMHQPDYVSFVPSLAVPNRMIMVQHLFEPKRILSQRDIYLLQRMVLPDGQPWLFTLIGENQTTELVQISTREELYMRPVEAMASPALITPPMLQEPAASVSARAASLVPPPMPEPLEADLTGEIYGH